MSILDRLLRRKSLADVVNAEVAAGRSITVMEPRGGLTPEQRRLIEQGVNLLAVGAEAEAADRFYRAGVDAEAFRVRKGKLVKVSAEVQGADPYTVELAQRTGKP